MPHESESVEFVRKPLKVRERSTRTLDQRLLLRFPRLASAGFRMIARLPPTSRIRQAFVWRAMRLGCEVYNRRDMQLIGIGYHPDFEYRPARNWVEAGLSEPSYHGPGGHRRYVEGTAEVFGSEVYLMPNELIDVQHHIVLLADVPMRAQASGIELTEEFALVMTMRDGLVLSIEEFYDRGEALKAAGLSIRA
jgi:ketosteroid isomerase-like protein